MTEAQLILQMIETVDPNDTAKLDEIDARVWCWLNDVPIQIIKNEFGNSWIKSVLKNSPERRYSRSRDVLKDIRLKRWRLEWISENVTAEAAFGNGTGWSCRMYTEHTGGNGCTVRVAGMPTEELAELHAIIQAIEYERTKP